MARFIPHERDQRTEGLIDPREVLNYAIIAERIERLRNEPSTRRETRRFHDRIRELFTHGQIVPYPLSLQCLWNINRGGQDHVPRNKAILNESLTFSRRTRGTGSSYYTEGVRADWRPRPEENSMPFTEGIHCWEISRIDLPPWHMGEGPPDSEATELQIGVGAETAPILWHGSDPSIGWTNESWGWHLGTNQFYHNGTCTRFPSFLNDNERYEVPSSVNVVLDMDEGTLGFSLLPNPTPKQYAIAADGLRGTQLHPMAAACEWTHVKIKYLRRLARGEHSKSKSTKKRSRRRSDEDSGMKDQASGSASTSGNTSKRIHSEQSMAFYFPDFR